MEDNFKSEVIYDFEELGLIEYANIESMDFAEEDFVVSLALSSRV